MCVERYVEKPKGQINKTLIIQELQSCTLALANSFVDQWNAKSLGLTYSIIHPAIIFVIYQREKV